MYERFLTEAARIEHRQALELTARRGWLPPAKPSITKKLAARIRARRRLGRNPVELVTQATPGTARVGAFGRRSHEIVNVARVAGSPGSFSCHNDAPDGAGTAPTRTPAAS
jgi:hypothetical protein